MKRRSFLHVVGGVAGGLAVGVRPTLGKESDLAVIPDASGLPRRVLGRTGLKVSIVTFPGLAMVHADQAGCNAGVQRAFDRGINYYDVAPAYGNGEAENKLGVALQSLDRSRYYLACKTKKRDKDGCREELERSLTRLKTDHFDVYQLHHLVTPAEVKQALGPGGALETVLKAKDEGKVRFIGFSSHTTKAALEVMRGFRFDTVMFPVNYVEYYTRGFAKPIMDLAHEQGAAILAIKPMSMGAWPQGVEPTRKWWYRTTEEPEDVSLALRFTLSLPGVVSGVPPSFLDLVDKAIDAGRGYRPITEAECKKLEEMAAGKGSLFKREEDSVASARPFRSPYPDHPHEGCPGEWA